ncbi:hypothetical protein DZF91_10360 [Actinomadura logoneensis]|uniref:Uncharacterized protein n=1 Tax=Actinomadura logoneensis TaxID=2293572 RepID=A0A372JPM7_9ACTN|nr:hypothetical protein [Actinomadura logoneensis]RFU41714.1 hypothetical protein DZF91_10360 [Actinomadura logoneensis]
MISVVMVYVVMVGAVAGLLAIPFYLARFAYRSRRAQFWQGQEDGSGQVRYQSPYVWARRTADEPRLSVEMRPVPRPGADSAPVREPGDESAPALAGSGAG